MKTTLWTCYACGAVLAGLAAHCRNPYCRWGALNFRPVAESDELLLWLWEYTDDAGKRRRTRYRLTEADARARLRDPMPVAHSLERRRSLGLTSDFLKRR